MALEQNSYFLINSIKSKLFDEEYLQQQKTQKKEKKKNIFNVNFFVST